MRFLILILTLTLSTISYADTSKTGARIDGVTDFLIDRAKENYMYVFEKKLKDNKDMQCFMPNILKTLTISGQGGLKQLINSKSLWRKMLLKDLEILTVRSLAYTLQKQAKIADSVSDINNAMIFALQKITVEYDGEPVRLDMLPIDAEQGLKDIVNGFYDPLQKITDSMGVFKGYASAGQRRESICAAPVHDITDFKQSIDGLIHVKDNLNEWLKHWNDNKSKIRLNATGWNELCNATGLAGANNQCTDEKSAKTYFTNLFLQSNSDSTKMVSKLIGTSIHLEQILAEKNDVMPTVIDALDRLQKDKILSGEAFQKFSKYIRFFGMLADATTGEEVKGILESFTLPAVSFYLKRESGHHLMLSSYFGFAQNMNKKNEIDESNSGFFVPVGLEYTFDKKTFGMNYDGALSIMVSPFDFGYPVNLKLNGTSENIEFDEIVAPSITIAYGFKEYPIVVGFGVQKGAKLDGMDTEERVLLFVAFDMPLFSLFDL